MNRPTRSIEQRRVADLAVRRAMCLNKAIQKRRLKGRTIAATRRKIAAGELSHSINGQVISAAIAAMDGVKPGIPVPDAMVRLALEASAMRLGGAPQADVWKALGISPSRGLRLLHDATISVSWPEWCVLWDASVGPAHHVHPQ